MDLTVTVGKLFALRARPWFAARCVFGRVAKHPWRVGASDRWWSGWTGVRGLPRTMNALLTFAWMT